MILNLLNRAANLLTGWVYGEFRGKALVEVDVPLLTDLDQLRGGGEFRVRPGDLVINGRVQDADGFWRPVDDPLVDPAASWDGPESSPPDVDLAPRHLRRDLRGGRIMKPWRYWWTVPLLIFVGIVGPGLAAAHDDPAEDFVTHHAAADICITLDANPTVPGLIGVMQGVADTGLSDHDAATAVALSVRVICPIHAHLLGEFVAMYRRDGKVA